MTLKRIVKLPNLACSKIMEFDYESITEHIVTLFIHSNIVECLPYAGYHKKRFEYKNDLKEHLINWGRLCSKHNFWNFTDGIHLLKAPGIILRLLSTYPYSLCTHIQFQSFKCYVYANGASICVSIPHHFPELQTPIQPATLNVNWTSKHLKLNTCSTQLNILVNGNSG